MSKGVAPMIHVPDVRATVDWYQSIGFSVVAEVDLYVHTDGVDELYERIKDRVEVVEGLRDTFFWITFGEEL